MPGPKTKEKMRNITINIPNNYDYNVFTGCKNIKSNFFEK